jgi:hypothetical protein
MFGKIINYLWSDFILQGKISFSYGAFLYKILRKHIAYVVWHLGIRRKITVILLRSHCQAVCDPFRALFSGTD